jgi:hypothetical protein
MHLPELLKDRQTSESAGCGFEEADEGDAECLLGAVAELTLMTALPDGDIWEKRQGDRLHPCGVLK